MADWATADKLTIRTFKRAVGNPSWVWQNTYELVRPSDPDPISAPAGLLTAFVDFERTLHGVNVEFFKAVISSYVEDGPPDQDYDPFSFAVYDFTPVLGQRAFGSEPFARHVVLHVKRAVNTGRSGKLFYRGCLQESDVSPSGALDWALTPSAKTSINNTLQSAYIDLKDAMDTFLGAGSNLALISTSETLGFQGRTVTGLVVQGVTVNAPDHRYFDRVDP